MIWDPSMRCPILFVYWKYHNLDSPGWGVQLRFRLYGLWSNLVKKCRRQDKLKQKYKFNYVIILLLFVYGLYRAMRINLKTVSVGLPFSTPTPALFSLNGLFASHQNKLFRSFWSFPLANFLIKNVMLKCSLSVMSACQRPATSKSPSYIAWFFCMSLFWWDFGFLSNTIICLVVV